MKLIIIILLCFEAACPQKSDPLNNFKINVNFFHKINSNIHTTINKLLTALKINKSFISSSKIQMLLKVHYYFNKMAQTNYRVLYEELRNISGVAIGKSNKNNLEELLQDVVKEEIENFQNKTNANVTFETEMNHNYTDNSSIDYLLANINELWLEISDLTMENIIDPIINETESTSPMPIQSSNTLNNTRRIYKGKKTKIKYYPFLVSLHIMNEFMCAGSIISSDMVITAASCLQVAYNNKLYRDSPRTIFARVGSDYNKRSGELVPIVQVIFHPEYDSVTLKNNLAIVKMLEKLKLSRRRRIRRIRYDRSRDTFNKRKGDITILGWGAKGEEKHKFDNFQKLAVAHLDIYNSKDCEDIYSKYYVTDTNFCAGFVSKGGGACYGDVGGPAVMSGQLVGVVSFGPTVCGMADAPTVFTAVGRYAKWIDDVISQRTSLTTTALRQNTSPKLPKVVVIPLFSTASSQDNKRIERAKTRDYPEEIIILKKLIQEFLLANKSVIDYIINGEDDGLSAENENKEKIFLDPDKFKPEKDETKTTQSLRILHPVNKRNSTPQAKYFTRLYHAPKKIHSASDSLETLHKTTHNKIFLRSVPVDTEDIRKKTTQATATDDNSEFMEDDYYDEKSGSYYELEIPIDETRLTSPHSNNNIERQGMIDMDYTLERGATVLWNKSTTVTTTSSSHSTKYVAPVRVMTAFNRSYNNLEFSIKSTTRYIPPSLKTKVDDAARTENNIFNSRFRKIESENGNSYGSLIYSEQNGGKTNNMNQWNKGLKIYISNEYDDFSLNEDVKESSKPNLKRKNIYYGYK